MIKIDFIGIGAEKSGTTWLADMLRQHPQIFLPKQKELHYFNEKFVEDPGVENYNSKKGIEWYQKFFIDAQKGQLVGEFSPSYLWSENAAEKIFQLFPKAKIIAILRNPSNRTFSQYLYYFQKGIIKDDDLLSSVRNYTYLTERSLYYEQIKRYIDVFGKENVHVFLFEDLVKNRRSFLESVENVLGVGKWIPKNIDQKSNVTGYPKNKFVNRSLGSARIFFRKIGWNFIFDLARKTGIAQRIEKFRNNNKIEYQEKSKLKRGEIEYLNKVFANDIENLEKLLNIDLSIWKNENN